MTDMSRSFTNPLAKSLYSSPQQITPPVRSPEPQQSTRASVTPSTPTSRYPSPLPRTPLTLDQTPTGKWSHPAVSEVASLQFRKAPNDTTLKRIFYNIGALFVAYRLSPFIHTLAMKQGTKVIKYTNWSMFALYILLIYNIAENMRRFWWTNTYNDPTLTEKQRNLLNLPPSPAIAAKSAAPITPPKYQRSYTPSPATQSPLSGKRSASINPATPITYQSALPLARSSPGSFGSPSARSVSMMNPSPSQSPLTTQNRASPDFQGSPRWRYSQSISKLQV